MNRFDFTPYRRSTVGFDRLFDLLENQARNNAGENYPPFNIERRGEDSYRITLAVAGFRPDDLEITASATTIRPARYFTSESRIGASNADSSLPTMSAWITLTWPTGCWLSISCARFPRP